MKILRRFLDSQEKHFLPKGKLQKFYPLYEMVDTFIYTPSNVTTGSVHVRDALDLKRMMGTVALALLPCILSTMVNTGAQMNNALDAMGVVPSGWRADVVVALGLGFNSMSMLDNFVHGALYFLPIFLVTNIAGGFWEVLFATIRKHEINEGFLVTGMLFPLTLPPDVPLWMVAVGISFGVVVGKEIFGGTGKNFLNPALTGRALLFFGYPSEFVGASFVPVDGYTGATPLIGAATKGFEFITSQYTFAEAFFGTIPGSMGETSTFAILIGAAYLLATGIGSWRIMLSCLLSFVAFSSLFYFVVQGSNPMFTIPPHWHLVLGGFAFATVFMATDPVSAAMTMKGQFIYGALIGFMIILVRVFNPAFPEGAMLAILFANCFAPLIDWFVVNGHIKKRAAVYE